MLRQKAENQFLREHLQPERVTVGDNVYIGPSCYFGGGEIVLEDEVNIGPFVTFAAGNHTMREGSYRFGPYDYGRIHVGRGTWLCANTVITSNITIGKGCLVAAGSVVTKDVPDYSMVGGVPAKLIKSVAPEEVETLRARKTGYRDAIG